MFTNEDRAEYGLRAIEAGDPDHDDALLDSDYGWFQSAGDARVAGLRGGRGGAGRCVHDVQLAARMTSETP